MNINTILAADYTLKNSGLSPQTINQLYRGTSIISSCSPDVVGIASLRIF